MVPMETGHFLKMLNYASLASLGILTEKVLGCIICTKKHCGYSRARLSPSDARLYSLRQPIYRDMWFASKSEEYNI